jgi:eukaryotic translation initiation factor 2C
VTHPGAGVANRPSVASLVFSWDPEACRYVAFSRVQSPRQELIEDLKAMMKVTCYRLYIYKGFVQPGCFGITAIDPTLL